MRDLKRKLLRWLLFSVVMAFTPLAFTAVDRFLSGKEVRVSDLLKGGELLLIASAIAAAAIGDLLIEGKRLWWAQQVICVICIINLAVSAYAFARIAAGTVAITPTLTLSWWLLGLAVFGGGMALTIAEVEQ